MNTQDKVKYWLDTTKNDQETAESLFQSQKYDWSLFLWHLVIEKLLKAMIANQNQEVPTIHNLKTLAEISKISFTEEEIIQLIEITSFNINARYDTYKRDFYTKATSEFTTKWVRICQLLTNKIKSSL